MTHDSWLSRLSCALAAAAAAFGGVGCLVSGFGLNNIPLPHIALWCVVLSMAGMAAFRFRKVPFLLVALLVSAFLLRRDLIQSVLFLVWRLSGAYQNAYGWARIGTPGGSMTLSLCLIAALSELTVLTVLYRGRGIWAAVAVSIAPLAACLVVTDAVPEEIYFFLLLLGLILLILPQQLRSIHTGQAAVLLVLLVLPSALFLLLLFLLVPRSTYNLQSGADKLESFVTSLAEQVQNPVLPTRPDRPVSPVTPELTDQADLSALGPQTYSAAPVMEVTLAQSGTTYLRGYAYTEYTGTQWLAEETPEAEIWADANALSPVGTVVIRTESVHGVLYIPYFSGSELSWRAENSRRIKEYSLPQYALPPGYLFQFTGEYGSGMEPFLALPEDTMEWARVLASVILNEEVPVRLDDHLPQKVEKIAEFVGACAEYDRNTGSMPGEEDDFAHWFLTQSDTGYCVHFATAATVLLRAAGIPARYVTGYAASGQAGQTVTVKQANAHAWVEYRLPGRSWVPLEVTPGGSQDDPVQPPQEQTPPMETTPPKKETLPDSETTPKETVAAEPEPPEEGKPNLWWLYAIPPVLIAGAVVGQSRLRLALRRKRQSRGSPNARALAIWQEYTLLTRLLRESPEKPVRDLAQKAKFSQYTVTDGELEALSAAIEAARTRLREKPPIIRLLHRLLFAAY